MIRFSKTMLAAAHRTCSCDFSVIDTLLHGRNRSEVCEDRLKFLLATKEHRKHKGGLSSSRLGNFRFALFVLFRGWSVE